MLHLQPMAAQSSLNHRRPVRTAEKYLCQPPMAYSRVILHELHGSVFLRIAEELRPARTLFDIAGTSRDGVPHLAKCVPRTSSDLGFRNVSIAVEVKDSKALIARQMFRHFVKAFQRYSQSRVEALGKR
jgi:hypothetical protein